MLDAVGAGQELAGGGWKEIVMHSDFIVLHNLLLHYFPAIPQKQYLDVSHFSCYNGKGVDSLL